MRAPVMHAAGDVRIENVPDPTIEQPTDALVRVTRACICIGRCEGSAGAIRNETGDFTAWIELSR